MLRGGVEVAPTELLTVIAQQQQAAAHTTGRSFVLPLLVFPLPELPTETLTLPVQEDCYRRMFSLVDRSASRLFGVALADAASESMESVGALCELTHLVRADQPGQPLLLVNARVVGRFQTTDVLCSEPFVTVLAEGYSDRAPSDEYEALQLAAQEQRVWHELLQVLSLGDKLIDLLTGRLAARLGDALENEELLRWSPSQEARSAVHAAPSSDTAMLAQVQALGLLGDPDTLEERTTEHLCQDALRPVAEDERRERFSFALASALGLSAQAQQNLLYSQSTAERLHAAEEVLLEWRSRLAACKSLHDL
ncbi:hypothetical protein COHA_008248 [Chlorella ohadii]|uniref:Lon N-terminal domain-containing protein n=1 Tax=Chlorella ohadii TaxID=2649997 RepID=A0AAD5DHT4_9CHLO|nr:hypothetical protein COHA_008248 [Chlorella ohadii]